MTTSTARDPTLAVYQDEPFNAGTPVALLRRGFTTPQTLFYARSHAAIFPRQLERGLGRELPRVPAG